MTRTTEENKKSFPNKEARYLCWEARDFYWACLDKKGGGDCSSLRSKYEDACPSMWVKHFDRKRDYEAYKKKLQYGYDPVDQVKET